MSSDDLDTNVDSWMLSDALDAADESFFLNAISEEATQAPPPAHEDSSESRDTSSTECVSSNTDAKAHAEPNNAVIEPIKTADRPQDENDPPQAMLIFVMGDHRVSDSCVLGVLNEHPEALKEITSNRCLSTSAFLHPALQVAMAELRPTMMVQVAVRLTAVALRLVAEILPNHHVSTQPEGAGGDGQQKLSETVRRELDSAVPYYDWQGPRNYHGRVQYLMALLEEAMRVLAVPKEALMEALKLDAPAARAAERVVQSILHLRQSPKDVCGTWAGDTLLSALVSRTARLTPKCQTTDSSKVKEDGIEPAVSPDSVDEDELPSPSELVRRKPGIKASQTLSRVEVRVPKVADDDIVESGSAGRSSQFEAPRYRY